MIQPFPGGSKFVFLTKKLNGRVVERPHSLICGSQTAEHKRNYTTPPKRSYHEYLPSPFFIVSTKVPERSPAEVYALRSTFRDSGRSYVHTWPAPAAGASDNALRRVIYRHRTRTNGPDYRPYY